MAVARMDTVYARRYDPSTLRGVPVERRARVPRRALAVGAILVGAAMQHILATAPAESQPTPLAAVALVPAVQVAGLTAKALPHAAAAMVPTVRHTLTLPHRAGQIWEGHHAATTPRQIAPSVRRLSALLPPVGATGDARRIAIAANADGVIFHVPSVSVEAIRRALRDAGSPAYGATYADHKDVGEYIWDAGRVLGIDPAVLLGIFRYESHFGTAGVARMTNSIGNIRPLAGQPSYNGYRLYSSWQEGIDDCYRLLGQYARAGAPTVAQAIPTWAPSSDANDPSQYVAGVMTIMANLYQSSISG